MKPYGSQFERLGALAERYFADDPNTCLIKLRQFCELLAQDVAARCGVFTSPDEPQVDLLRRVKVARGGSVDLNRFWAFSKWFSALVTPPLLRALAG